MGLCCTPVWRDSLKYLDALKNYKDVSINTLVCIVNKAFEQGEYDLGWIVVQNIFNQHGIVPLEVFTDWFNVCEKNSNCSFLRVLEFLRDNEFIVRDDLAELIRKNLIQFGSKITTTIICYNK